MYFNMLYIRIRSFEKFTFQAVLESWVLSSTPSFCGSTIFLRRCHLVSTYYARQLYSLLVFTAAQVLLQYDYDELHCYRMVVSTLRLTRRQLDPEG